MRGLGRKRSLALGEFALGIEGLERFIRREPLRRVHECVFGVLALESEPVDQAVRFQLVLDRIEYRATTDFEPLHAASAINPVRRASRRSPVGANTSRPIGRLAGS